MKNEATKEIRKPPLGLQSRWSHEGRRLREVLNAIERYVTVGVDFPQDWIFELQDLAVSPHMTLEDIQEAYKRISEVWALPFMVDREMAPGFLQFSGTTYGSGLPQMPRRGESVRIMPAPGGCAWM